MLKFSTLLDWMIGGGINVLNMFLISWLNTKKFVFFCFYMMLVLVRGWQIEKYYENKHVRDWQLKG